MSDHVGLSHWAGQIAAGLPPVEVVVIKDLPRDKQREIQNVVDALIAKAS